ncbi:hypothetical protein AAC387_Pa05g0552 [Persea americana]
MIPSFAGTTAGLNGYTSNIVPRIANGPHPEAGSDEMLNPVVVSEVLSSGAPTKTLLSKLSPSQGPSPSSQALDFKVYVNLQISPKDQARALPADPNPLSPHSPLIPSSRPKARKSRNKASSSNSEPVTRSNGDSYPENYDQDPLLELQRDL